MLEVVFILAQLGVVLGFLVVVAYSKHLHIGLAPLNILFSRRPDGLGPPEPMRSGGKVLDFEEADPDTDVFGIGKVEDLSWKGMLDLASCTECGRRQSQCPAWATGKPLSPKQLILDLRDHAFAEAPYLLTPEDQRGSLPDLIKAEATRPLVGGAEVNGVIDPEVIWACTNCGAGLDLPLVPNSEWVEKATAAAPAEQAEVDDEGHAVVLFTSGTTSQPKRAVLRHRNLVSYVLQTVEFASATAVAYRTVHRPNGYFITTEGWEYVAFISAAAVALAALGPGQFSADRLLGLDDAGSPRQRAALAVGLGIGGAAAQLAAFWRRPPRQRPAEPTPGPDDSDTIPA